MEARMAGEWFVEFYPEGADTPDEPTYFDGFPDLIAHMQQFRVKGSAGRVRVHLPATATDEEHRQIRDLGTVPG
jgi:hypothetical protein